MNHQDHHEHDQTPGAAGFGKNTNGLGVFFVAVTAVLITLFCWAFWKDGSKEADFYRLNTKKTEAAHQGHGAHGSKAEEAHSDPH